MGVGATGATLQEVVEASSHPSCPTACTLRGGASIKAPVKALTTFQGGILEGAHGLAASEAARDPSTNRGSHSVMPRRKESKPYLKAMSLSQRSTRLSLQVLMLLKSKKKKMVKMVIIRPQRKHKPQPKIKLSQSRETVPKQRKSPRVKKSTRERGRGGAFWRG